MDFLSDRGETRDADDKRTLVDLLVEQIEFADVVVVNKVSDVTAEARAEVRRIVTALNPDARVVETDFGHLPLAAILDTGLFDEAKAARHPLWHKELYGAGTHVPETEEYGIKSFVYRARRPFDPARFQRFSCSGLARSHPRQGAFLAGDASGSGGPSFNRRLAAQDRGEGFLVGRRTQAELAPPS